jgi:glyceraldehyde-3-phosphate dehydrogenase (NAD(P))
MAVSVGINGYGTIGKRIADAVSAQDDMEVVGVTKTRPTIEAHLALDAGFRFFSALPDKVKDFEDAGISVEGTLSDLMEAADLIVDCTPGKFGEANRNMYNEAKVKGIFQGGEKHALAGTSFNSFANYSESLNKQFVRVVSCNTTGLCRTLYPVDQEIGIDNVFAVMIRRAVDPRDSKKGPVNAIEPVLAVPSHHGPDVQTCMHDLNIQTMAVKVPTTLMHLHALRVELKKPSDTKTVQDLYEKTTRVKLIEGAAGLKSTAEIMEMARDLGRARSDLNEIAVWRDGINVEEKNLYYYQAIHQESDVVPENIDCIRAMMELETDNWKSIEKTNKALGIN